MAPPLSLLLAALPLALGGLIARRRRGARPATPGVLPEAAPPRQAPPPPAADPEPEEPPASVASSLPVEMWARVMDALGEDGCRAAAALACSFKAAKEAFPQSKWSHTVRIGCSGWVLEPANGAFDVTVAPGEDVQAAVDASPPGGCVLLLPGTHDGPLVLGARVEVRRRQGHEEEEARTADKEVHVFGRGQAILRATTRHVLTSVAATATLDGLIVRPPEAVGADAFCGVWIAGGALRLQACDITGATLACLVISGGAGTDPMVSGCK